MRFRLVETLGEEPVQKEQPMGQKSPTDSNEQQVAHTQKTSPQETESPNQEIIDLKKQIKAKFIET